MSIIVAASTANSSIRAPNAARTAGAAAKVGETIPNLDCPGGTAPNAVDADARLSDGVAIKATPDSARDRRHRSARRGSRPAGSSPAAGSSRGAGQLLGRWLRAADHDPKEKCQDSDRP